MSPDAMFQNNNQNDSESGYVSRTDSRIDFKTTSRKTVEISQKIPNPTLGTIKMVEETLSKMSEYPTKNKLWRALPRQVQYPIFKEILKYLGESNKLMFDNDGTIIWTFIDSPELKKLKENTKPLE